MLHLADFTLYPVTAERATAYAETLIEPATAGTIEIDLDGVEKIDRRFLDALVTYLKERKLEQQVVWVTDDGMRKQKVLVCAYRQGVSLCIRTHEGIPEWIGVAPLGSFPRQEYWRLEKYIVAESWKRRISKNGWQVLHHTRVLRLVYEVLRADTGEWELQEQQTTVWVEDGALSKMRRMLLRDLKEKRARRLFLEHLEETVGHGFIRHSFKVIPITQIRVIPLERRRLHGRPRHVQTDGGKDEPIY